MEKYMQEEDSIYLTKEEIGRNKKLVYITLEKLVELKNDLSSKKMESYTIRKLWLAKAMLKVDVLNVIFPDFKEFTKEVDARILRVISKQALEINFTENEILERLSFIEQAFIVSGVREKSGISEKSILKLRKEFVDNLYKKYQKMSLHVDDELEMIKTLQRHLDVTDDLHKKLSNRGNQLLRMKA